MALNQKNGFSSVHIELWINKIEKKGQHSLRVRRTLA